MSTNTTEELLDLHVKCVRALRGDSEHAPWHRRSSPRTVFWECKGKPSLLRSSSTLPSIAKLPVPPSLELCAAAALRRR
jgi:hypothetical protein